MSEREKVDERAVLLRRFVHCDEDEPEKGGRWLLLAADRPYCGVCSWRWWSVEAGEYRVRVDYHLVPHGGHPMVVDVPDPLGDLLDLADGEDLAGPYALRLACSEGHAWDTEVWCHLDAEVERRDCVPAEHPTSQPKGRREGESVMDYAARVVREGKEGKEGEVSQPMQDAGAEHCRRVADERNGTS